MQKKRRLTEHHIKRTKRLTFVSPDLNTVDYYL